MIKHATTEVFLDNVRIPASALIGEEGRGFRDSLSGMNTPRILIAAECIGDGKWFIKRGADHARERVVFGAPIGINQRVQFPLARGHAFMMAAETIVCRAAAMSDSQLNPGIEANTAKMLAADASWEAAEACLQTHGGFGVAEEYEVERKFREARLYKVAPISTDLIRCYIAEQVLSLGGRTDLPDSARAAARLSLFDWMVCGVAAVDQPVATILRNHVRTEGGHPVASLFGGGWVPARAAARANGAECHALDYGDTHFGHVGHLSAGIYPAAMAAGGGGAAAGPDAGHNRVVCHAGVWTEISVRHDWQTLERRNCGQQRGGMCRFGAGRDDISG